MNILIKHKSLTYNLILSIIVALLTLTGIFNMPISTYAQTNEPISDRPTSKSTANSASSKAANVANSANDTDIVRPNVITPNSATLPSSATGSTTNEVQEGTGSATSNSTDGNTETGKQFVTVETKSGKIFYLIIDHDKTSDNVFLLTEVNENDLLNFVENETDGTGVTSNIVTTPNTQQPPTANDGDNGAEPVPTPKSEAPKSSSNSGLILFIVAVIAIGGAAYYFLKVKKGKSNPLGSTNDFDFEDDEKYEDDSDDLTIENSEQDEQEENK